MTTADDGCAGGGQNRWANLNYDLTDNIGTLFSSFLGVIVRAGGDVGGDVLPLSIFDCIDICIILAHLDSDSRFESALVFLFLAICFPMNPISFKLLIT